MFGRDDPMKESRLGHRLFMSVRSLHRGSAVTKFSLIDLLAVFDAEGGTGANRKGVRYEQKYVGELPEWVEGDPELVRRVLHELVGRAIFATERGFVDVSISHRHDELLIVVRDSGAYVAPTEVEALFGETQNDCRAAGGDVAWLASDPGLGSIFTAQLPVKAIAGESHPAVEIRNPHPGPLLLRGRRVLLVEDSTEMRFLAVKYLRSAGADVTVVTDGEDALAKARAITYDVILMDLQLPGRSGLQIVRELRAAGYARPIVAMTAHAFTDDRRRSLAAGCDEHLSKPVIRQALIECVHRLAAKTAASA